ncbi:phosphonate ABC transporter, permease protein PhnE [Bosea sp. BIWAKO-01]|uniref:phosphonate ABC transporter, permease protein PhnE n=1 Tax=Bosea sp. BIWAKO-01 TaxID=506668 RepID=UPI000853E7F6|nr:phosphonate ABC transporter, permease protein PhnE [Bosea sp. BIWAKO-01]GAU85293.1 phosphonate ABC transporter permease protein phnE2 [Bosea sp. BIWAKO-01]
MSATASPAYPTTWRPPSLFGSRRRRFIFWAAVVAYVIWSVSDLNIDGNRILAGLPRALDIFARMVPPDFSRWEMLLSGMVESIQIAIASTIVGALLAIPIGLAAAANLSPRPLYFLARGFIVIGRTFHEVIIAIFFVKLFGFGPVAGLLTLAFSSAIFLGKMLAEDIENMKEGPVEAIRATGASFGQVVGYAVVPQVMVKSLGVLIYRLDANLRHSTVIGIVGAGGIGQTLSASFSRYDFDFSSAILLTIAALVALGEWFSDWARRRLR